MPKEDATVLREEMARTGISGQMFKAGPSFKNVSGPAFLVYYSPAFIRTLAPAHAFEALRVLAEVYRRARGLWPLGKTTDNAHSVSGSAFPFPLPSVCFPGYLCGAHGAAARTALDPTLRVSLIPSYLPSTFQPSFLPPSHLPAYFLPCR